MKHVRIYKPTKTAMQSGRAKTGQWILEYEPQTPRRPDPLMGWTSAMDTMNQVRLTFNDVERAITYAQDQGWNYTIHDTTKRRIKPRSYLDNFKYVDPTDKAK